MFRIKRVIVGVEMPDSRPWDAANLAPPTRLAVRQAFQVAAAMNASVDLVCVLPEVSAGLFGNADRFQELAQRDVLEATEVLTDLKQQYTLKFGSGIPVREEIAFGRAWLEILKAAGPDRDNMIICGTRDQSVVGRLLFGSTGLKLLRNAPCPVWLVKPRIDDDADMDVLAATDLTEVGMNIMHAGVALGQSLPVRLNVLTVIDDDLDRHMARAGADESEVRSYRAKLKSDTEEKLHEQLAMTDYRTVAKGVKTHVAEGSPDACILSAIQELDIDLLLMATAARGGIPGMLLGNTAERLLPEIPCSVLAIKPDDFQCPVEF
ncbi:MAG: universal stress protein [Planctomycetaceae bacterium]